MMSAPTALKIPKGSSSAEGLAYSTQQGFIDFDMEKLEKGNIDSFKVKYDIFQSKNSSKSFICIS